VDAVRKRPESFKETKSRGNALDSLSAYQDFDKKINEFRLVSHNRQAASWTSYTDINTVMLATSLAPNGFFG
jgi:hypothetical protein